VGKLLFATVTFTIEITEPLPSILSIAPQDSKLLSKILTGRVGHAPAKGWGWGKPFFHAPCSRCSCAQ